MSRLAFTLLLLAFLLLCATAAGFTREPACQGGASSITYLDGVASVPERTGC